MSIAITREPDGYHLRAEQWLPRPLEEVFLFFADAFNLERLTPPFLRFRVLTPPPIEMRQGLHIDYRLSLHGVPLRWQSEIAVWDPPHRFVDVQTRGPYRCWHHEHTFTPRDGGVLVSDHVQYRVWGGAVINQLFVQPDVMKIFAYRADILSQLFSATPGERSGSQ